MVCDFFKASSECEQCSDNRCQINGGFINPAEMCGCDYCNLQRIIGDKEECLHETVLRRTLWRK